MDFFQSLLASSGISNFISYVKPQTTPILTAAPVDIRDQQVFEIDANTWGWIFSYDRLGLRYATSPKTDPFNLTLQSGYVVQSSGSGWDMEIDACTAPFFDTSDNLWKLWYGDFESGKVGYATKSGSFGTGFTKYAGNPIVDNTAATDQWNQYIRHICGFKYNNVYYIFFEGRAHDNNELATSHKFGRMTSNDGLSWSLDADPVFDVEDYPGTALINNALWMPEVARLSDGKFYLAICLFPTNTNDVGGYSEGFLIGVNDDPANNSGWVMKTTQRPLIQRMQKYGDYDSWSNEEPCFFEERGNVWLVTNGAPTNDDQSIMYYQLIRGNFVDAMPASLFEDDFDDASIDTAKWTTNPTGGITIVESNNQIKIIGSGATTQALVNVLIGKTAFNVVDVNVWCMTFIYSRLAVGGGTVEIGVGNAGGTNKAIFKNDPANINNIILQLVLGGVSVYSQTVALNQKQNLPNMLQVKRTGHGLSWWTFNPFTELWENLTVSGTLSFHTSFCEVASWASENVYPIVNATNNNTTAYTVKIDNLTIKSQDHSLSTPFLIQPLWKTVAGHFYDRTSALTAGERTAIETFLAGCDTDGNLSLLHEVWFFGLNGTDAPIGLKFITTTPTNTTHSDCYTFNGTTAYIDTNYIMNTFCAQSNVNIGIYVKSVGNQTVARNLFVNSGSPNTFLGQNGTNIIFRINQGAASTNWACAQLFANDTVYEIARSGTGATTADVKLYKDGVSQTITGGDVMTGVPTTELTVGANAARNANFFDGSLYMMWVTRENSFDHAAMTARAKQLMIDI